MYTKICVCTLAALHVCDDGNACAVCIKSIGCILQVTFFGFTPPFNFFRLSSMMSPSSFPHCASHLLPRLLCHCVCPHLSPTVSTTLWPVFSQLVNVCHTPCLPLCFPPLPRCLSQSVPHGFRHCLPHVVFRLASHLVFQVVSHCVPHFVLSPTLSHALHCFFLLCTPLRLPLCRPPPTVSVTSLPRSHNILRRCPILCSALSPIGWPSLSSLSPSMSPTLSFTLCPTYLPIYLPLSPPLSLPLCLAYGFPLCVPLRLPICRPVSSTLSPALCHFVSRPCVSQFSSTLFLTCLAMCPFISPSVFPTLSSTSCAPWFSLSLPPCLPMCQILSSSWLQFFEVRGGIRIFFQMHAQCFSQVPELREPWNLVSQLSPHLFCDCFPHVVPRCCRPAIPHVVPQLPPGCFPVVPQMFSKSSSKLSLNCLPIVFHNFQLSPRISVCFQLFPNYVAVFSACHQSVSHFSPICLSDVVSRSSSMV